MRKLARRCGCGFYYHTLLDRPLALGFLLQDAAWHKRPLFLLVYPKLRQAMTQFMNINGESAKLAEERLRVALERLDSALDGRRFLVEDCFSQADITACALLSRYCLPNDIEASARFPAAVLSLRDELKGRRFYRWVRGIMTVTGTRCPKTPAPITSLAGVDPILDDLPLVMRASRASWATESGRRRPSSE